MSRDFDITIAIAHAAFVPERKRTLERLITQLGDPCQAHIHVQRSETREHASVWAMRLWEWAGQQKARYVVLLNDDVQVPPRFVEAVEAACMQAPTPISLHTSLPCAPTLAFAGERWVRTYWLTGPGYVLTPEDARKLVTWWRGLPAKFRNSINEDNAAIHLAYRRKLPFWSTIPGLVEHDTSTSSVLGYDKHPLRVTTVPWHGKDVEGDITDPEYWRPKGTPIVIDNPWMPTQRLEITDRALRCGFEPDLCWVCEREPAAITSPNGVAMGPSCLANYVRFLAERAVVRQ